MFLYDLLFVLILTLILVMALAPARAQRRRYREGERAGLLFFFFILFFTIWAGGIWVQPFGPPLMGVHWMPFLTIGIIVSLLLLAAIPPAPTHRVDSNPTRSTTDSAGTPSHKEEAALAAERDREVEAAAAFSLFFWMLIGVLLASVIINYSLAL